MSKIIGWIVAFAAIAVAVAIIFRVPKLRAIVTGTTPAA